MGGGEPSLPPRVPTSASCEEDEASESSSLGIQSGYVRSQIQKQKRRGNWVKFIAAPPMDQPPLPDEGEGDGCLGDVATDPTGRGNDNEVKSTAEHEKEHSAKEEKVAENANPTGHENERKENRTSESSGPSLLSARHSSSNAGNPRRVLSSASLVGMLKIQPICEVNELHDDIDKYNLSETVQIDKAEDGEEAEDDVSEVSALSDGGNDDEDASVGSGRDSWGGTAGLAASGELLTSSGTFLPLLQPIVDIRNPILQNASSGMERRNADGSKQSREDSSTFYLQSISSADNITHMSSASDYDYYSMTSDDEDEGQAKAKAGVSAEAASTPLQAEAASTPLQAEAAGPRSPVTHPDQTVKELSQEVCQVLGMPQGSPRNVRRGIMSRNTELKLRSMAKKADHGKEKGVAGPTDNVGKPKEEQREEREAKGTKGNDVTPKNDDSAFYAGPPKTVEANEAAARNKSGGKGIDGDDDSSSSGDSSLDHVFGEPSRKKREEKEKWERIRRERESSRASLRKERRNGSGGSSSLRNSLSSSGSSGSKTREPVADAEREPGSPRGSGGRDAGARGRARKGAVRNGPGPKDGARQSNFRSRPGRNASNRNATARKRDSLPRQIVTRPSDDDDDAVSVFSASVSAVRSRFGSMYRRLSSWDGDAQSQQSNQSELSDDSVDEGKGGKEEEGGPSWDRNVLTEGEYYLAMSMLVYIYALLRETSMLGHTDISFDEIDVNSFQSDPGFGGGAASSNKFLSKTKSAGFIVRVVMDELEKEGAFSGVEKNEGDMSVLQEFKRWVKDSRSKKTDAATEQTIRELRRKVARRRWRRAIHAVRLMVRLGKSKTNGVSFKGRGRFKQQRRGSALGSLGDSITGSIHDLANALKQAPSMSDEMGFLTNQQQKKLSDESDIRKIIDGALDEPRFFIEGSLLNNLIESGIEVVYFGDRHPNDVVYSICCNRQYKRVSVVFRGTVNSHNWLMNMKFAMTEHPNPIAEDYPGREDTLGLHTGFSLYLTRQRKDDSLTKIEEIFSNIDSIGRELAPDGDYELSIAGHSLGGALASILSFYAATSSTFARLKTIRAFTYAAPRVGCQRFARAFQHLERVGRIRLARFTNTSDLVPLIPFHGMSRSYKHVGMHIRLHGVSKFARYWLRQALDVTYPKHHGVWSQMWRGFQASLIRNLSSVQGYKRNHTLTEHQSRIRFALEYRSILDQAAQFQPGYFHNRIRSRLKTLDEYYFIKGASNSTCTGELTRVSLEDRAKDSVRREARKIIVAIALIALLEAVVLGSVYYNSIPCENYPLLLYPVYILTGCRAEESAACADPHGSIEVTDPFQKNDPSPLPEKSQQNNANANNAGPKSEKMRRLWTSSWMKRLWEAPHPSRPPCVWGFCNFRSRPHLPWGVPLQRTLAAVAIDTCCFDSSDSRQELSWEAQMTVRREEIHFRASEMVLASSTVETAE